MSPLRPPLAQQSPETGVKRAEGQPTIVSRQHAKVVAQSFDSFVASAMAPALMSACRSLRCRIVKPSNSGGSRFESTSLVRSLTLAALARPRQ